MASAVARRRSISFRGFSPTSEAVSRRMARNRKEGGRAERMLRSELWRAGIRFRLHRTDLPGTPDIVLSVPRIAVFCDGDFWHGRNWNLLRRQLATRRNADYWLRKIASNRRRDRRSMMLLADAGWTVLRFWETDILKRPSTAVTRIWTELRRPI